MSTAIAGKKLSTRPVEPGAHQRARQSKAHPDCRSTTIKSRFTKISLALSSGPDNHPPAATAEMAILIVAVFPSRLSRYTVDRPLCRDHDCWRCGVLLCERLAERDRFRCRGFDHVW